MATVKYKRKKICKTCGGLEKSFCHLEGTFNLGGHPFEPRLETDAEAAYRQGYEDGYNKAQDRAVWGPGWD